jgi:CubicO group peptidase (beta-lactamase class C family)
MRTSIAHLLALFFFVSLTLTSSQAQITEGHEDFDKLIASNLDSFEIPGLSIALIKEGEVVFENAYGFANEEKAIALDLESNFAIASLSKAFTAAAVGMLVDEGKLNWDDRVQKHLPGFNLSDEYVASQMTIEDLLSHRSGFKTFDGDLLWYSTNYDRREIIKRFQEYPMSYDFRTQYGYQNIMFIIAGEIVEEVSGMSWEDFVEQRIFEPLEMDHSHATYEGFKKEEKIALPHVKGKLETIRNYDNSGGAAAISSNVKDLSHWIQMWLNEGVYDSDTLLQAATCRKLIEMHTPIPLSSFDRSHGITFKGYGLGWFLMAYGETKVAHHGGGLPGYISKIFILPNQQMGGIILTNGESSMPSALMYESIDEFVNMNSKYQWIATYLDYKKRYETYLANREEGRLEKRGKAKSNIEAEALLGEYEDRYYGKATISQVKGKLQISLLPAAERFTSEMTHWQQNTYQIKFKDHFLPAGYVTFESNADAEVVGFKIDLPNPDFHFHNLEFKKQ